MWTYEYRDKPRPCYRIRDGSDDGDVAEAWDEHVAKTLVGVMNPWEDVKDEWTPAIRAAHPTRSDSHEEYATAMQMVGHRHSKGELVALVNWLLVERKVARDVIAQARNVSPRICGAAGVLDERVKAYDMVAQDPQPLRPRRCPMTEAQRIDAARRLAANDGRAWAQLSVLALQRYLSAVDRIEAGEVDPLCPTDECIGRCDPMAHGL